MEHMIILIVALVTGRMLLAIMVDRNFRVNKAGTKISLQTA
jgi:hypothetical protein